jgi:hypothetical protein
MSAFTEQVSSPHVRFYDNEENNWDHDMAQHRMGIEFFLVDNVTPNVNISSITKVFPSKIEKQRSLNRAYIEYFAGLGNAYATFLNTIINSKGGDIKFLDKDYPSNGFEPDIPELIEWSTPSGQAKYVIFDWDKTITAVEGMHIGTDEGMHFGTDEGMHFGTHEGMQFDIPIHDVALFVMGGEHRLQKVREAIRHLKTNDVGIFIITNNPNATKRKPSTSRGIYLQLINIIFSGDVDADSILYCAKDYGYKKWKSACAIEILKPHLNCPEEPGTATERGIKRGRTPEGSTKTTAPKKATGKETGKKTGRPATGSKTAKSVARIGGKRTKRKKTRRTKKTRRRQRKTKKR